MIILKHVYKLITLIAFCFFLVGCQGVQFPAVDQMIANFGSSLSGIWRLVTGASYLLGIVFIFRGVYQLKLYGDLRTMMSTQTNFKATLMLFFVGAVLLFYQPATEMIMMSSFGTSNATPIGYSNSPLGLGASVRVVLKFVQIIGFVSFIRGWIYFTQANQGGQNHFGKAITHIVGGILAINIEGTADVLKASFGVF